LPVVLHGHETWSVTIREKHRLSVIENSAGEDILTEEVRDDGKVERTA
jgi:hypothetical protein